MKSNRICYNDGELLNIKELAKTTPEDEWQKTPLLYKTSSKWKKKKVQYIASKAVILKSLGKVKMVFVKSLLEEDVVLFVGTNWFELSVWKFLGVYSKKWRIETFFRDCKQNLALSGNIGRYFIGF